jgi:hypothetical protein
MNSIAKRIIRENSDAFGATHPELQAAAGVPLSEIADAMARSVVVLPQDDEEDGAPVSVSAVTIVPGSVKKVA